MARQKKPSPTPVPSAERTLSKAGARRRARRKSPAAKTPPSSRRRWTLDEAAFLEALPTAVRNLDDPVVQVMRANPGSWIVWNEATRAVHMVTDHIQ